MSKIDHTNTVCCNCGSNKTYMRRGRPEWTRYKDKSYLCTNCNAYLNRYGTLDKSKIYDERMTYLQKKIIDTRNELKKRECCICRSDTYIQMVILAGIKMKMKMVNGMESLILAKNVLRNLILRVMI